jgi:uncharacterized Zn finger protein (UPF0148 family)
MGLLDELGVSYETDQGMYYERRLEALLRLSKALDAKAECPKCHQMAPLFFGDPNGDHWCVFCQMDKELEVLEREAKELKELQKPEQPPATTETKSS